MVKRPLPASEKAQELKRRRRGRRAVWLGVALLLLLLLALGGLFLVL